ncbi:MAG TPA: tetratricopeptide repeat protein [Bryobacteraceae bacterium]|nr:tetratricopeptide repeat protein [Bryobacteraceae bacterium]
MEPDPSGPITGPQLSERPEIAHVLFLDVVAFTTLPMEEQRENLKRLQQIVRETSSFRRSEREKRLISLPTGDGMALAFFGDAIASVECAFEISESLRTNPNLKVRMGLNSGLVYQHLDINANLNVQGGGINEAQRIMDAGDAGHILASKVTAGMLEHLKRWAPHLDDLGEHEVKHGKKIHFYNLYTGELGNPALPAKFRAERDRARRGKFTRLAIAGVIAAVLAAAGFVLYQKYSPIKRKQYVAVMGFRNSTGNADVAWVDGDLTDNMRAQLGGTEKLRTISGQESAEMWKNLGVPRFESLSKRSLAQLKSFGADFVVVGSYNDQGKSAGGKIHLIVELQDAGEGETIDTIREDGTEAELDQLVARTATRLREKLGLGELSRERTRQLEMAQAPPSIREFYYPGLEKLRNYEPQQARSYLERAVEIEPAFPLAHAALAEARSELGYDKTATEEAKRAVDLSKGLSFEDQQSIEGRYYAMANKWDQAIGAYEKLYHYKRDNLEYGLQLAKAQWSAGKGSAALATLAELRKLPKPEGDDARIDLAEAETAKSMGDSKGTLKAADSAAAKAKISGAKLLRARSLHWTCAVLRTMGEPEKAKPACEESRNISRELDDKLGIARADTILGTIQYDKNDLEGAKRLYQEALDNAQQVGSQKDVSGALNNLALVLDAQGDLEQARQAYEKALATQRDISAMAEIPGTLNNIGALLRKQGDLPKAQEMLEKAIQEASASDAKGSQADALANLGDVLVERGILVLAELKYTESIAIQPDKSNKSDTLVSLGNLLVVEGKLDAAEQRFNQSQSPGRKTGLASILLARGSSAQAESAIRSSLAEVSKDDPEAGGQARLLLVRALLNQGKSVDALKEMVAVNGLVKATSPRSLRYGALIASARVQAATGPQAKGPGPVESLQKVALDAKKAGMPGFELEARLAIGEIELAGGKTAIARKELEDVQREAAAKSFGLIEQEAAKASRAN